MMLDDSKKFDILFDTLKEKYKEHMDFGFKIIGVLFIVVGWFTVSTNPLPLLCNSEFLVILALVSTALGEVAILFLTWIQYARSAKVYKAISAIEEDERIYSSYMLTKRMMVGSVFGHFVILLGIFFLIYKRYVSSVGCTCKVSVGC